MNAVFGQVLYLTPTGDHIKVPISPAIPCPWFPDIGGTSLWMGDRVYAVQYGDYTTDGNCVFAFFHQGSPLVVAAGCLFKLPRRRVNLIANDIWMEFTSISPVTGWPGQLQKMPEISPFPAHLLTWAVQQG